MNKRFQIIIFLALLMSLVSVNASWNNQTFRLDNPNIYGIIINASNVNVSDFTINNCQIFNLSSTEWLLYENVSNDYETSRAQVIKTLFYGINGNDARVTTNYIQGLTNLYTIDTNDNELNAIFMNLTHLSSSNPITDYFYINFNTTINNTVSSWSSLGVPTEGVTGSTTVRWYCIDEKNEVQSDGTGNHYSDETGLDKSSDETINPSQCYIYLTKTNSGSYQPYPFGYALILTRGNITLTNSSTGGGPIFSNTTFKNEGIPSLESKPFDNYFDIQFINWNNTYKRLNITITSGVNTYNFSSETGYLFTNILNNNTNLWNISITGDSYFNIRYTNYNASTDIVLNTTINYTHNAILGYVGETSNISINLSKTQNQSYISSKLIYNTTTYSSPTLTNYTNNAVFNQTISNTIESNQSYYWNITLNDTGNVFSIITSTNYHPTISYIFYINFTNSTSFKVTDNLQSINYTGANTTIHVDDFELGIVTISWNSDRQIQEFYNDQTTDRSFYLYNTGTTFDTSKTFLVTDFTEELENALVTAQIWITSTSMWRNVYGKLTNTEGLAEVMLNTNSVYRIKVSKEGYDDYYKIVSTADTSTDIIRIDLTSGEGTYSAMVDSNCINYAYINQTCYVSIICGDTCTYTYINVTRTISGANTTSSTQTTTTTGTTYGISLPNGTTNIYINTGTSETGEQITLTPEVIDEITNRSMASSNLTNAFTPDSIKGDDDRVKIYAILIMLIGAIIMGVAERKIAMGIGIWAGIAWFLLWSIAIPILSILALIMFSIKVIPILYKRFFVN